MDELRARVLDVAIAAIAFTLLVASRAPAMFRCGTHCTEALCIGRQVIRGEIGGFFPIAAPLVVVARTPNNLHAIVTGNDGRVYTSWWSGN